mmetsp:Transcript_2068/g.3285  ORF Transcript_2068/g.3285 Transcript_2068/m.3285 type:complete len:105 (+) Transcript_2068:3044-3358(+)
MGMMLSNSSFFFNELETKQQQQKCIEKIYNIPNSIIRNGSDTNIQRDKQYQHLQSISLELSDAWIPVRTVATAAATAQKIAYEQFTSPQTNQVNAVERFAKSTR